MNTAQEMIDDLHMYTVEVGNGIYENAIEYDDGLRIMETFEEQLKYYKERCRLAENIINQNVQSIPKAQEEYDNFIKKSKVHSDI